MNFFRIPDPRGIFLLIKLASETIISKKKVLFFIPIFMYSRIRDPVPFHPPDPGSGSGIKKLGIWIRDPG
jgi:hypothetical protein